ncbi:MAG: hypothetical protein JXB25_04965 [Deltaproteobacteria bacterium]|nr:hypothetical protein [Deltaproteobacteria bacterium]
MFSWAMDDWANSSFVTVVQTFIFAAYFTRRIAVNETLGSNLWGNAIGIAGLLVAFGGPVTASLPTRPAAASRGSSLLPPPASSAPACSGT